MSSETNAVPDTYRREPSLLDQIHAARDAAKSRGQNELAQWLTRHADEPCPAAIAEALALPADVPIFKGRSEELALWLGRRFTATRGHGCPCGCGAVYAIAAIDAPAGEGVSASDWCLAVTCPPCGARCQQKSGHGFGVPHAGACAVDCRNALPPEPANAPVPANGAHPFGACCSMKAPPFCPCPCHTHPVVEPVTNVLLDALTESANAQGSEAVAPDHICLSGPNIFECPQCTADRTAAESVSPSAPPFAAEERTHCVDCDMPYGGDGWLDLTLPNDQWELIQSPDKENGILCANCIVRRASRVPRADAIRAVISIVPQSAERDDALERAAEDVIKAWAEDRPVNSSILNLRSVLAQRAKGKA